MHTRTALLFAAMLPGDVAGWVATARPRGAISSKPIHAWMCSVDTPPKKASLATKDDVVAELQQQQQKAVDGEADVISKVFSRLFAGGSGKEIYFGVLQRNVDPSNIPSEEERAARRAAAAKELVNIGGEERERRRTAGLVMSAATAALALGLLAFHVPPLARAAVAPPLFLSYGYLASAETGL